jgi:hypothetical protein
MNYPQEKNYNWKKNSKNYSTIHSWLIVNFKKDKCESCGATDKKLDWALLKGRKYLRKIENFKPLCRSCHLKYDYTKARREKVGRNNPRTKKHINRLSPDYTCTDTDINI